MRWAPPDSPRSCWACGGRGRLRDTEAEPVAQADAGQEHGETCLGLTGHPGPSPRIGARAQVKAQRQQVSEAKQSIHLVVDHKMLSQAAEVVASPRLSQ